MADSRGDAARGGRGSRGRGRGRGRGRANHRGRGSHHSAESSSIAQDSQQEYNAHLTERFRGQRHHNNREERVPQAELNGLEVKLNPKVRQYVEQQVAIGTSQGVEDWLSASEVATSDEVSLAESVSVKLPANKIDKPYKNTARYLKTHYKLLREDAVGPLRDAIDDFKKSPDRAEEASSNIYEKVYICGFTFTQKGVAARIKFSTRRATRRIAWRSSKRLVSGSIVALSPVHDQFRSKCIMAIVAARPLDLLERKPPEIDIYFGRPEDGEMDPQQEFVMIEATAGYYEAYRHTLRALQKMSAESFPLSDLILAQSTKLEPPSYLSAQPQKDMSAVRKEDSTLDMGSMDIVDDWPESYNDTTLDATQWAALRQILTKNLAIIQGPPGTGKTHVSKIALQIMVDNQSKTDPPIIIAAQTNHALDQLLEHVSTFEDNYIRLGGRSTNSEIKKHALYEVQTKERIPNIPGSMLGKARRDLDHASIAFGNILSLFAESAEPISAETFFRLHIITEKQLQSLFDAAKNWMTTDPTKLSAMQLWLHKALIPFEIAPEEEGSFGFYEEDDDLEFEQVNEVDAEHGVDDEEDIEQLRGPWKAVRDQWTVTEPTENDIDRAKKLLDTKQDLWSVPDDLRGPMYMVMRQRASSLARLHFCDALRDYDKIAQELKIGKWEKDLVYLKRACIIGMTTTGLSKYRPLISSLEPTIILIEEAAEVIEGPIAAACIESLEHLILVGDHQQLQGHCSVSELADQPYNLNISMFQRLVNMNMPFKMLLRQRRMRPEFRQLISPLYPRLEDHSFVYEREVPQPWGMGNTHSFFFTHEWLEMKDSHKSTYNEEEARLVVKFYRHLLRNGLPPAGATILTFYNGQRRRILRELRDDPETATSVNIVKTVDSYQGEENDVIILSLVRSNTEGQIGFLDVENRVCVALSRAKYGFYLFGNAELLAATNSLWFHVKNVLGSARPQRIGGRIPITCQTHERILLMQYPEDFDGTSGGCDRMCGAVLDCGHPCPDRCHPYPHDSVKCRYHCEKSTNNEATAAGQDTFIHGLPLLPESNNHHNRGRDEQIDAITENMGAGPFQALRSARTGQKLARGGGAFQQQPFQSQQQQVNSFISYPFQSNANARSSDLSYSSPGRHAAHPQQPDHWTNLAKGRVHKADQHDDKTPTSPSNYRDRGVQADLLGLSLRQEPTPQITNQTQQDIGGGRTRYAQEYQLAAPSEPVRPSARWDTRSPSIDGDW